MQLQAGYIIEAISNQFADTDLQKIKALIAHLSNFEIESNVDFKTKSSITPIVATVNNQLCRGMPTRMSLYLERQFATTFPEYIAIVESEIDYKGVYKGHDEEGFLGQYKQALYIIDPRISSEQIRSARGELGSPFEAGFIYESLPETFNIVKDKDYGSFLTQLFEPQRSFKSIVDKNGDFTEQAVDFCIEFPYQLGEKKGLIVEIDGSQHDAPRQTILDRRRDKAVAENGWANTIRIKTSDFGETAFSDAIQNLITIINENRFLTSYIKNFKKPLLNTDIGQVVLQLSLSPIAIARVQKVILELMLCNVLAIDAEQWNIAILERDVPCAYLAIEDLKQIFNHLSILTDDNFKLPKINLKIFVTKEFADIDLNKNVETQLISEISNEENFDFFIDISMLQKKNFTARILDINSRHQVVIRSSYAPKKIETLNTFYTAQHIKYSTFTYLEEEKREDTRVDDKEKVNALRFFLSNLFRKKDFRPGQLPILQRALQGKSVIGLLPTGGGKSLTYQFASLLQAGIVLVIDPIKSLMVDQYRSLQENLITASTFINSYLDRKEKEVRLEQMQNGELLFLFVSPERMQMQEFRNVLSTMHERQIYFSYCVIDEVHCVSEWGHDFRTPYLRLGQNTINHCKTFLEPVPLFGLTATASFDVLADVQRELSNEGNILEDEAIVRFEGAIRPEIQYKVVAVEPDLEGIVEEEFPIRREVGLAKQAQLNIIMPQIANDINHFSSDINQVYKLDNLTQEEQVKAKDTFNHKIAFSVDGATFFSETCTNAGIIFCPHRKGFFGVTNRFHVGAAAGIREAIAAIGDPNLLVGTFMGTNNNDINHIREAIDEASTTSQEKFLNNELNLLVSTKAFGMGIDKDNIRFTIHLNYPSSIEAFVQESGRAARDGKMAVSYLLLNTSTAPFDNDYEINSFFHKQSFKGASKEQANIDELLNEIYYPDRKAEIIKFIQKELGVNISIKPWKGGVNRRLYVNSGDESLGYINMVNLNSYPQSAILDNISNYINANAQGYYWDWFHQTYTSSGINGLLNDREVNKPFSVIVGYGNNTKERTTKITRWLKKDVHKVYTEKIVNKFLFEADGFEDFIERCESQNPTEISILEHCHKIDEAKGWVKGTTIARFEVSYNGFRNQQDTEKAIYRLTTIGVIDDYTIDYNSKTYELRGRKKPHKQYKEHLKSFILKYYSNLRTNQLLQHGSGLKLKKLNACKGTNLMAKSLNFLVDFVYERVAAKRKLAIGDMKEASIIGLEKGNLELKEYIDLYFNSKYARENYEIDGIAYSLLNDTLENKEAISIIYKYIKAVDIDNDAEINNLKHLRGACTRLRRQYPDNYVLTLLLAYVLIRLEYKLLLPSDASTTKNSTIRNQIQELLVAGFTGVANRASIEGEMTEQELKEEYEKFRDKVFEKESQLNPTGNAVYLVFDDSILEDILLPPWLESLNDALHTLQSINHKLSSNV